MAPTKRKAKQSKVWQFRTIEAPSVWGSPQTLYLDEGSWLAFSPPEYGKPYVGEGGRETAFYGQTCAHSYVYRYDGAMVRGLTGGCRELDVFTGRGCHVTIGRESECWPALCLHHAGLTGNETDIVGSLLVALAQRADLWSVEPEASDTEGWDLLRQTADALIEAGRQEEADIVLESQFRICNKKVVLA